MSHEQFNISFGYLGKDIRTKFIADSTKSAMEDIEDNMKKLK